MIKKILFLFLIITLTQTNICFCAAANNLKNQKTNNKDYSLKYNSIMFSQDNINDIFEALSKFKNGAQKSNIEAINKNDQDDSSRTIGESTFFLNSILYISDNYWTVWINENKITNQTNGDNDIKIINITPGKVNFAWSFGLTRWDIINPDKIIPESMYTIKDNQVTLYFSLKPNQSFIPSKNEIIEGKLKQVVQEEKEIEQKQETEQEPQNQDNLFF